MANYAYHTGPTGATIYAKPLDLTTTPSWSADAIGFAESVVAVPVGKRNTFKSNVELDPNKNYQVFQQVGVSKASGDLRVAIVAKREDSFTIAPGVLQQQRRDDNQLQIECYVGETISVSRFVVDGNDPPQPVDLTGMNLQLVIETKSKLPVATIDQADISIVGDDHNGFLFDLPLAVTQEARVLECSLRNLNDGKRVWGRGAINVRYAPLAQE